MDSGGSATIGVHLGALDDTTARSVAAFLEGRHRDRFSLVGPVEAAVVLVDLDQPAAEEALAATRGDQIPVGVGFDPQPCLDGCRRYVQKPLTGAAVLEVLAEAAGLVREAAPVALAPPAPDRLTRGRDVFRPGRPAATKRTAPVRDWAAEPAPRLDRERFARAEALATSATLPGTTASAGEVLARRQHIEEIAPHDGGDLADPGGLRSVGYEPAEHLDGLLARVEAEHAGHAWEIRSQWGSLVGDPATGEILVSAPDATLRLWCHAPLMASVTSRRIRAVPDDPRLRRIDADVVRWNVTVWCSRGRLPREIDPFVPVAMRAWPDLTRCVVTPSALPIVALLTAGPHRPVDVAEKIGASRSHVFVVLAGAHHLGLLEGIGDAAGAEQAHHTPPPPAPPPHRGVLRRLLGRLGA